MKGYFDLRMKAFEDAHRIAHEVIAAKMVDLNHLRELQKDFISKAEYVVRHDRMMDDIRSLQLSRAELSGKANQGDMTRATIIGIVSLVLALASVILEFVRIR